MPQEPGQRSKWFLTKQPFWTYQPTNKIRHKWNVITKIGIFVGYGENTESSVERDVVFINENKLNSSLIEENKTADEEVILIKKTP